MCESFCKDSVSAPDSPLFPCDELSSTLLADKPRDLLGSSDLILSRDLRASWLAELRKIETGWSTAIFSTPPRLLYPKGDMPGIELFVLFLELSLANGENIPSENLLREEFCVAGLVFEVSFPPESLSLIGENISPSLDSMLLLTLLLSARGVTSGSPRNKK